MPDVLDSRIRFAIERACTDLAMEYARSIDFRDYDNIVDVFTEDATLVIGEKLVGRAAILEAMMQRPADLRSRHVISNVFIDVVDDRNARGICYLTLYRFKGQAALERGAVPLRGAAAIGHYEDTFVRTPRGWRIAHRVLHLAFRDSAQFD
jgi:3-phenylpropionate/cinnamic acid dioxygenase small subunit